jgi:hypothetical protein
VAPTAPADCLTLKTLTRRWHAGGRAR